MEAIGSEGTGPELEAEETLDALGVGYDAQPSFGRYRPDFELPDGSVLQVHGAFWHGHPAVRGMDEVETNEDYWTPKLRDNVARDKRRRRELLVEYSVPYVAWVWEVDPVPEHVAWHCRRLGLVEGTLEHRFWSKVEKRGFTECWPWQAGVYKDGRGQFYSPDSWSRSAPRVGYRLWYDCDPLDRNVLHKCGNANCVNPRHMYLGDQSDNTADALDHGTLATGADYSRSDLDEQDVREIRMSDETLEELADEYDVSFSNIGQIKRGETWQHVEVEE
jgi:DNA mismatch endonuclease Vsr